MKVYIAGPMTGYPEFNFPAFFAKEEELAAQGWVVANPANKEDEKELMKDDSYTSGDAKGAVAAGFDFRSAFLWDATKVIEGNAIYMLKGWEQSPGARAEHAIATVIQKHYPDYQIMYEV